MPFRRLFVANRGEVAARVARTCDALGIVPVFAVSEADRDAPWVRGRESVVVGPARPGESYLNAERLVQAAVQSRCAALHPGWGFLSESPRFAALAEAHGVTFVGPPAHVMALMGKKTPAKRAMSEAGLRVIPGSDGVLGGADEARSAAERVGFPVLLKAESGGGGRGMRIVESADLLERAFGEASAEAEACFADPRVYLERLITGGRHVEVQVFADRYGNVVHFGARDCTVQRKHQKLIEESPPPGVAPEELARTLEAATAATKRIGYVGAGTLEFLQDAEGKLRFMEMNTRLQVEHTVSEMRTGVDLVAEQLKVAAGEPLSFTQDDVRFDGHVIECRINAEDPADDFRPSPGTLTRVEAASEGEGIRVDTHVDSGYRIPPHYDSLICKVLAKAPTRDAACDALLRYFEERFVIEGVPTTVPMHQAILASDAFRALRYDTSAIPGWPRED